MRYDARLTMVHSLAQGLLTHHMTGGRMPFVIRSENPHTVVSALRTVAAAADYSLRGYPKLPVGGDASGLPPRHVVVRQGPIAAGVADQVVELGRAMPDDALIVLVLAVGDDASMDVLGTTLLAAGVIDHDGDQDLEPRQRVPSVQLG